MKKLLSSPFIAFTAVVLSFFIVTPVAIAQISDEFDVLPSAQASRTLPILHIYVYGDDDYDNDILSRNLAHKEYFNGYYWFDNGNGMTIGSESEPLKLKIKARGNFSRTAYSKKPFKLKLEEKQSFLGLPSSRHFAILPHADDYFSYLRNFTAFNLGKRIQLPWTPSQHPIEVYINGDYRGLYFLTENIRIEPDRVNIEELNGQEIDPALISGGYIVEMDNYKDENQFIIKEHSYVEDLHRYLAITVKSPDSCSDEQFNFLNRQFEDMNEAVGKCDDNLWSLLDMDDAARYYLVMEIIGNTEAYGGSTYLYRGRGEGEKWHFSPLWDCGHAFEAPVKSNIYNNTTYAKHWIASMCENEKFKNKICKTWMWFMSRKFSGFYTDVDEYIETISEAAKSDHERWKDIPTPNGSNFIVSDNSNIRGGGYTIAIQRLKKRIEWLCSIFGDYRNLSKPEDEPQRDNTPAQPLSPYLTEFREALIDPIHSFDVVNLQGVCVKRGATDFSNLPPGLYIANGRKVLVK